METDKGRERHRAQRGDLIHIPSPFWGSLNRIGKSSRGLPEATRFDCFQRKGAIHGRGGDRRLTMINLIRVDGSVFEDVKSRRLVFENKELDEWDHIQYLEELMVRESPLI